jgi:hypothetical protein
MRGQELGVREIARRIDRSPATVSRELRRNVRRMTAATTVTWRMAGRGSVPTGRGRAKLNLDVELREVVQATFELEWSPEQIAAHLRKAFPDRPQWHIGHETVYRALYLGGQGGLNRQLTRRLRTGRPLRKRCRRADERRSRFVPPARRINPVRPPWTVVSEWAIEKVTSSSDRRADPRSARSSIAPAAICAWSTCPAVTVRRTCGLRSVPCSTNCPSSIDRAGATRRPGSPSGPRPRWPWRRCRARRSGSS